MSDARTLTTHSQPSDSSGGGTLLLGPENYRLLFERLPTGIMILRDGGRIDYANPHMVAMSGYAIDELLTRTSEELLVPHMRELARARTAERMRGVPGQPYDLQCLRKDGSTYWGRVWGTRIDLGLLQAVVVTVHDVTEIREARDASERRAQLLDYTEDLARIGSAQTDAATGRMHLSAGICRLFGEAVVTDAVTSEWLYQRVPPAEKFFVRGIAESVTPGEGCEFQHRITHTDGALRTVLHRAVAETDAAGNVLRTITILQDITAQRDAEQRADTLSNCDALTGLANRKAFLEGLDGQVRVAERSGGGVVLLCVQIVRLALVAESLGQAAAETLLRGMATRLAGIFPDGTLVAHLGDGGFAVALDGEADTTGDGAMSRARSVLLALTGPLPVMGSELDPACGIGVAVYARDGDQAGSLLDAAQAAMYQATAEGDNRICAYSADAQARRSNRLATEAGLRRALRDNAFRLVYQPQLDLASGAIIGVEALLRWTDPERGPISPVDFIPVAEETGLILPIGDWVLHAACEQALAWQRAGLPAIRVAVNLSMHQLQEPGIAARIQDVLLNTGLDPCHLGVEVTESALMGKGDHVSQVLRQLQSIGIEISLDDFGTGYSSLNYLRKLPIDVVKVDRSFVHDVTAASQDVSMTRAIITMAHSLQMKVLAEGVETEGQLVLLAANHCDQMQGYFFSKPVEPDVVAAMLRDNRRLPAHLLAHQTRQRTLLLVDDEENIVAALKRLLRRDGYTIVTASSGAEALRKMAECTVDVIVTDQRMPSMTGVELLRRAKELYPETVRMVLSGYTELQSITDAINEGAIYRFLTKPWDDERLREHIREAFRQKELTDENRQLAGEVGKANRELAEVNSRLQRLLAEQQQQIHREEASLSTVRDMLESLPAGVIGIDLHGMVAFTNDAACDILQGTELLLGGQADQVFPKTLAGLWRKGDGEHAEIALDGRRYHAVCRVMHGPSRMQGSLIVLTEISAVATVSAPTTSVH